MEDSPPTRVLIVDDDASIRDSLRAVLEDEGFAVVEAGDGAEALRILLGSPASFVVLSDYMMPRVDGAALLDALIKHDTPQEKHRLIYMTARDREFPEAFASHLHELKIPVVRKPFEINKLTEVVDKEAKKLPESE